MKKIIKLFLSIVMTIIIVGQGALPAKAAESNYIEFTNDSYASKTVAKVGETIDLTATFSGGYYKNGVYAGEISDDVVKVKYTWYITSDNDNEIEKYYDSATIGIGSSKTITTEKLERGIYIFVCKASRITESGKVLKSVNKSIKVSVGMADWVTFENTSSISKTAIKKNESISLTSRVTGGYSRTGMFYGAQEADDVVKVEYIWIGKNLDNGEEIYFTKHTLNRGNIKTFKTPAFTKEGYYSIKCIATGIRESGEKIYNENKSFLLNVGGKSWVDFQNTSSVSKTLIGTNQTVNMTACGTGGYSPTGLYTHQGYLVEDVVKVEYTWRVQNLMYGSSEDFHYGPYTLNKGSSKTVTSPKLKDGLYTITSIATPITKDGVKLAPVKKTFKVNVGGNDWIQFRNTSSTASTIAVGKSAVLLGSTKGGYSRTGLYEHAKSDDVSKIKYVWYVTDYKRKKYNQYYKSTGYVARGSSSVITSEKLQEGKYKFTCYAYAVTKNGVSLPVETKDIVINVIKK